MRFRIQNTTVEECREYAALLKNTGFTRYAEKEISAGSEYSYNVNLFYTHYKDDICVFTFWDASIHTVFITVETLGALPNPQKPVLTPDDNVAPIYMRLPLYIRLKNADAEKTFETDIDIRKWIEGKYEEKVVLEVPKEMLVGEYEMQIGIGGNGEPSVVFATNAPQDGEYSVLGVLKIV